MTLDAVVAAISDGLGDITPTEVAEALWLAPYLSGPVRRVRPEVTDPDAAATGTPPARLTQRAKKQPPPPDHAASGGRSIPASRVTERAARMFLPDDAVNARTGLPARSPAMPALPDTLGLSRGLRPLRRRVHSRVRVELDEVATAEASALAGRWVPRLRPAQARWMDLVLVVDDGPSMVIWRRTVAELRTVLEREGAFRTIRLFSIDTGAGGANVPRTGRGHDPRELLTTDGRRLLLVLSDCVGASWRNGTLIRWVEQWGRTMPTAILQPLPQRLWNRCALDVTRMRLGAPHPGAANRRLSSMLPNPDLLPLGVAVPILEIEPRWLAPWARLVAGVAAGPVRGAGTFTGWSARDRIFGPPAVPADTDPVQVIRQFRAGASPEAYDLARHLAAAPLSLPVMRLVQNVSLPGSKPQHLAEFFLSPLLRRVTPEAARQDPERVVYDFRDGVREILAGTLRPETGLQILAGVSDFISHRFGGALDFPAILAGDVPAVVDEANRPFAEVALTVLRTLGGRYRVLADQLASSMRRHPLRTVQPVPMQVRTALPPPQRTPSAKPGTAARGPGDVPSGTNRRALPPGGTVTTPMHRSEGGSQPPINQPAIWGDVPPRNPNFTGRHQLLTALREQLTSKVTALLPHTLHGLGGVGKTQLAVEYVYRYAGEYDVVWWVPSEQPSQIRQSMLALAPRLGLTVGQGDDLAQTLTAIDDALRLGRPYRRWLLVFDNAHRADDLKPFLSNPTGHILITSRNRSWGNVAETVEVDVFERQESIELLTRRLPDITLAEADKLAEKLGDLPLALEQAAAWQAATATPATEYLQLLEEQVGTLMSESKPSDYPEPVAAAWGLAFTQLTEQTPAALQLLELCAFLGSEPISVRLLRDGRHIALPMPLSEVVRDDIKMRRAIRDISRYGLAKVDSSRNSLQVHRLVQAVLRDRIDEAERVEYRRLAHSLLSAANPGDPEDQLTWTRHAELSTHVGPANLVDGETAEIRKVVLDQIRYQYLLGDFESSRELAEVALAGWRRRLGNDDEQTLVAGRMLGNSLRSMGRIAEARVLNEEIYARSRSVFGANHEHTLVMANSMGADLRLRGDWTGALELDREMFVLHRQVFAEDDPSTLLSANNLAVDHRLLGQFQEALDVDTDARDRLERTLGPDHPFTLRIISNMSRDFYGLGDYAQAIALQRQSLPTHRRVLGPEHLEVLRATRIHVVTLRKIGALAEAAELAEELVATSNRRLGDQHPDSMVALMTQSNCLAAVRQPQRAKIAGEDALARMSDVLGPEHPFTYAAMTNLATIMRGMGDYGQARSLDEQSVQGFQGHLDAHHSYALCARMNLANDIAVDHDHARAYQLGREVLAGMVRLFGPTHPQTLVCTLNLSLDLAARGRSHEAREMHDQVVSSLEEVLGAEHPESVNARAGVRASIEIEPPNP